MTNTPSICDNPNCRNLHTDMDHRFMELLRQREKNDNPLWTKVCGSTGPFIATPSSDCIDKKQTLDMLGLTYKELRETKDPFELMDASDIDQLRTDGNADAVKCILELANQLDQLNPVCEALTAYITSSAELAKKHNQRITELEEKLEMAECLRHPDQANAKKYHSISEILDELNKEVEIYLIPCTNCDGHVFNNCGVLTCDGCQWEFELVVSK